MTAPTPIPIWTRYVAFSGRSWCTTDGCDNRACWEMEYAGVASRYCDDCAEKIQQQQMTAPTPTPDAETREALIEIAMEAAKREHARFTFGGDSGRTFENSFTVDFHEQFAEVQGRHLAAAIDAILASGLVVPLDIAEHVSGECMAAEQECYVLRGQLAERDAQIARLTQERDDARARAYGSIIKLTAEIGALSERATVAEQERDDARAKALEEAAQVIDGRARNERNRAEQHKAAGKHYKAREAAHVARIAEQDAARIRALTNKDRNDGA